MDAVDSSQLYMFPVLALLVPNPTTVPLLVAGYVIDNLHVFVDIFVNPESQKLVDYILPSSSSLIMKDLVGIQSEYDMPMLT